MCLPTRKRSDCKLSINRTVTVWDAFYFVGTAPLIPAIFALSDGSKLGVENHCDFGVEVCHGCCNFSFSIYFLSAFNVLPTTTDCCLVFRAKSKPVTHILPVFPGCRLRKAQYQQRESNPHDLSSQSILSAPWLPLHHAGIDTIVSFLKRQGKKYCYASHEAEDKVASNQSIHQHQYPGKLHYLRR